jgi:hypothetical protein
MWMGIFQSVESTNRIKKGGGRAKSFSFGRLDIQLFLPWDTDIPGLGPSIIPPVHRPVDWVLYQLASLVLRTFVHGLEIYFPLF